MKQKILNFLIIFDYCGCALLILIAGFLIYKYGFNDFIDGARNLALEMLRSIYGR